MRFSGQKPQNSRAQRANLLCASTVSMGQAATCEWWQPALRAARGKSRKSTQKQLQRELVIYMCMCIYVYIHNYLIISSYFIHRISGASETPALRDSPIGDQNAQRELNEHKNMAHNEGKPQHLVCCYCFTYILHCDMLLSMYMLYVYIYIFIYTRCNYIYICMFVCYIYICLLYIYIYLLYIYVCYICIYMYICSVTYVHLGKISMVSLAKAPSCLLSCQRVQILRPAWHG